ncbi:MAG: hypothetical protein JJ975_08220 [Bacteroidia bacterium]|nr:hypothetical protein [Bacteroidia bacterium]
MIDTHAFTPLTAIVALFIGLLYVVLVSLIKEPNRQHFNALMVAGAGAAYLNGGLMELEFVFCTVMTYVAFKGLKNYNWLGVGWLLHTGWDLVHHFYGNPIVPMDSLSSLGCAICDPVIALWFFMGAPSIFKLFNKQTAA